MSKPTKKEKLIQDKASKEEMDALRKARENNKDTKYFHAAFHARIAEFGK